MNWSRRKVGGAESYLESIIPALFYLNHDLSFLYEIDLPTEREPMTLPKGTTEWNVEEVGAERAIRELHNWHPDLIYAQGLLDSQLESQIIKIAPTVFRAHNYYGNCISGHKTYRFPVVTPCHRAFGLPCLVQYYPRRCGGLNPITMLKEYRLQSQRLENLRNCRAIVANSSHIKSEYLKKGFKPATVYNVPPPYIKTTNYNHLPDEIPRIVSMPPQQKEMRNSIEPKIGAFSDYRLMFLGRMDFLKGGITFLDALPIVAAELKLPLKVTFTGDGPERQRWEAKAQRISSLCSALTVDFVGYIDSQQLEKIWRECDLLVVPSLWPEPFGLVGLEAGLRGVPVAAFAAGGIPDWLKEGVNGYLAPDNPPTASGLAGAILKCLGDPVEYARIQRGAVEMAKRFSMERHVSTLLEIFDKAITG